jgi:hypothetical protein
MPTFTVLCRIDAFADYVAEVEAGSAAEAARLADDTHQGYEWHAYGVQEFDARIYVTLKADGSHDESTKVGDF